jgi:hypothetical protein
MAGKLRLTAGIRRKLSQRDVAPRPPSRAGSSAVSSGGRVVTCGHPSDVGAPAPDSTAGVGRQMQSAMVGDSGQMMRDRHRCDCYRRRRPGRTRRAPHHRFERRSGLSERWGHMVRPASPGLNVRGVPALRRLRRGQSRKLVLLHRVRGGRRHARCAGIQPTVARFWPMQGARSQMEWVVGSAVAPTLRARGVNDGASSRSCSATSSTRYDRRATRSQGSTRSSARISVCAEVIARHDGHISQYAGDGLVVYFGYPLARGTMPSAPAGRARHPR